MSWRGRGGEQTLRYRSVMSLAATLGLFPMISQPGGHARTTWSGTGLRLLSSRGGKVWRWYPGRAERGIVS